MDVRHIDTPDDADLVVELEQQPDAVAIAVREDVAALRYALAIAHLDSEVPMVVTIFDRTVADQLRTLLPQVTVMSPAEVAAPSLAGPCLSLGMLAAWLSDSQLHTARTEEGRLSVAAVPSPRPTPWRRLMNATLVGLGHHDAGSRMMMIGLAGLLAALAGDWVGSMLMGHGLVESYLEATRVVATVGPSATDPATFYAVFSGTAMLATVVFAALFTAGLVDRLVGPQLVGFVGARSAPRSGHVIVVGMGQVGIRLCAELRRLGVPVVGVERSREASQLRVARALRIPVVIGHGQDRELLERVGLRRCMALAAVGSYDLDNIAVALAANAVSPNTRVVLRAGEQEAIAETRSLLPLGTTRDVLQLATSFVVAAVRGMEPAYVVAEGERTHVLDRDGRHETDARGRSECGHPTAGTRGWPDRGSGQQNH